MHETVSVLSFFAYLCVCVCEYVSVLEERQESESLPAEGKQALPLGILILKYGDENDTLNKYTPHIFTSSISNINC